METYIYNIETFLEIKKKYIVHNTEIETLFNKIFNLKKKKIYFKQDFSIDEKKKNELISYLNKISPKNYGHLFKNIYEICVSYKLTYFLIETIFRLSTTQSIYCSYYVKIIKQFLQKTENRTEIMDFIKTKTTEFKNISFNNNIKDNIGLSYDEFCENNKLKIFKKGYSQFLGELYLNNIIEYSIIIETLNLLFSNLIIIINTDIKDFIEDSILCIETLCTTVVNKMNIYDRKKILNELNSIHNNPNISKRLKFKIMDLKESLYY